MPLAFNKEAVFSVSYYCWLEGDRWVWTGELQSRRITESLSVKTLQDGYCLKTEERVTLHIVRTPPGGVAVVFPHVSSSVTFGANR